MNHETAALYLPLVKALAEGKTIQSLSAPDKWDDITETRFLFGPERYRIKPDPKISYLNLYPIDDGRRWAAGGTYNSLSFANGNARSESNFLVKVTQEEGQLPKFEAIPRY